jgi:hypothetical protein
VHIVKMQLNEHPPQWTNKNNSRSGDPNGDVEISTTTTNNINMQNIQSIAEHGDHHTVSQPPAAGLSPSTQQQVRHVSP